MVIDRKLSFPSVTSSVRQANLVLLLWAAAVTYLYRNAGAESLGLVTTPFTILGAAITIFLGFRTNTAYDRWWEARTLWGGVVNRSRTLVRQAFTFGDAAMARDLACLQIALVNALRAHLRKQDAAAAARPYLAPADAEAALGDGSDGRNVPSALLKVMGLRLRDAFAAGRLDPIRLSALDASLSEMTDLLGACERIKNTPLPRQYDTVPQLAIYAYSVLLPLGLVQSLGWWTPLVSSLITFVFIAIDSIGSNIEDPFENTLHDVPMTALCRTIEIDLRRLVGETEGLPRPVDASRGVLM